MRELRKLHLPYIVAGGSTGMAMTALSSDDVAFPRALNSSSSSEFAWSASDCSAPPTPTFSVRGHSRISSSNSSLVSSSPVFEQPDGCASNSKLVMPQLAEDPSEREDAPTKELQSPPGQQSCASRMQKADPASRAASRSTVILPATDLIDLEKCFFGDEPTSSSRRSSRKRRKSDESSHSPISSRLGERFPSLSKRWTHRKQDSKIAEPVLQIVTTSGPSSTRSSSLTSSVFQTFDQSGICHIVRKSSCAEASVPASPIEITHAAIEPPIDREKLASTPLLPPMMTALTDDEDRPVTSPLQSPTIADSGPTFSTPQSPIGTPQLGGVSSPPLSTRPSVSSFQRVRGVSTPTAVPLPSDASALVLGDPNDEWAMKLGHANFTIEPQPYVPDVFDAESCRKLIADWERARVSYSRHQHRTIEHYGINSKTYRLTELKWSEIDAEWKKTNELATHRAAEVSSDDIPIAPAEPARIVAMPALHNEPKFPKLGDQDIVGPMEQVAARVQNPPRKNNGFMKILSIRIPTSLFGRSATR